MFKTIFLAYIRRLKRDDLSTYAAQIAFFSILSIVPFLLLISMWLGNTDLLDLPGLLTMLENTGALPQTAIDLLRSVLRGLEGSVGLFSLSALDGFLVLFSYDPLCHDRNPYGLSGTRFPIHYPEISLFYFLYHSPFHWHCSHPRDDRFRGTHLVQCHNSLGFSDRIVELVWNICRMIVPIIILLIIFWSLYTVLPTRRIPILDSLPGALLSTVALLVVSQIFSFFVNNGSSYSVLYGGLSSFTAILLWFYLFGYIFSC